MNWSSRWSTWCVALVAVALGQGPVRGADEDPFADPKPAAKAEAKPAAAETKPAEAKPAAPAAAPAAGPPAPAAPAAKPEVGGPYRKLAPGVMITIPPATAKGETFNRQDMVELLAVDPKFDWAKNVPFRRDIWCLEFSFKPMRLLWVDEPQEGEKMRRKLIWYMVYSVTNSGKVYHPSKAADGTYDVVENDAPVRFIPQFLLENQESQKRFPDRLIPIAVAPITQREDPKRKFHTFAEMSQLQIKPGETVWGVATWEDLDTAMDKFSVYIHGLTNAYQWTDEAGTWKQGDTIGKGRRMYRKALKLNFWRPGDEFEEKETEIRYGAPGQVDYEWLYR